MGLELVAAERAREEVPRSSPIGSKSIRNAPSSGVFVKIIPIPRSSPMVLECNRTGGTKCRLSQPAHQHDKHPRLERANAHQSDD